VETTAARYDGGDVLRISGRLKLVYDAAARGHDIPSHCTDCDCEGGAMIGAFVVWLGHEK
jgi:hypothetical protein